MKHFNIAGFIFILFFMSCTQPSLPEVDHPDWVKKVVIYEVNVRQFSPEGTFKVFQQHIPRLQELGVDILWLMPIHPIGEKNRKGTLGSFYSVKDYQKVNPEFGSEDDLRELVSVIHSAGMKVIIDWVGNHTARDNWLTEVHPDWYVQNNRGSFIPPHGWDWTDVIVLDYEQKELRNYMIESMEYWVSEFDIDGFRCDVARLCPDRFLGRRQTKAEHYQTGIYVSRMGGSGHALRF